MATYFVDFVNGLDANNGLGPDAGAVTNKPWKTIAKLLGAAGMASGDTAYLSPAGQFREAVTVAMTSAVAETQIIGDPSNAQGFRTAAGVLVAPGPVIHTGFLTNDKTASASIPLSLAARDFLTFKNIMFVCGTGGCVSGGTGAVSISFTDCAFSGNTGPPLVTWGISFAESSLWTFTRCYFAGGSNAVNPQLNTGVGADYDSNILITDCLFLGGSLGSGTGGGAVKVQHVGGSAQRGGGVDVRNCTFLETGASSAMTTGANISLTIPCTIVNCHIRCAGAGVALNATTLGQITENYNLIDATTPRTNVNVGANSISDSSYAPLFHFAQERIFGQNPRPVGEPMAGSPFLGFGNDGTQAATDLRGTGHIRPAGGSSSLPAIGAMERANTFVEETVTVRTGSNAITCTGPAYQEFLVPVNAVLTTISVYVQWDGTYTGTKPQLQIDANGELVLSAETITATGASGSWEKLTLTGFVASKRGIVRVRLISNDTNGAGKMYADDFAVV